MTSQEWLAIIAAIGGLVIIVGTQAVLIINATKASRDVKTAVEANTADRAVKSAETLAVLAPIATQVNDIHAGTNATPAAAPTPIRPLP